MKYQVRQIDAWWDGENWTYNDSWSVGTFKSKRKNIRPIIRKELNKMGIYLRPHYYKFDDTFQDLEIQDNKGMPLFLIEAMEN